MSKNQEYAEQYAEFAKEQMKRYGIPASVTLAQGILESSNGQSELARKGNNHFGIKATSAWLRDGGGYLVYTDDRPDEKFCKYASVGDSYEHHSQFLKGNGRYAKCFTLPPDDYKGWTESIEKAGYATGGGYAAKLQQIIERNGLQKYDRMVMQEMKAQGKSFGVEGNPRNTESRTPYSFPVSREEYLFVTSPFGMRTDPMDKTRQQMHKGIDIRTDHDDVLATEADGKVVGVNHNAQTAEGKSVTVEYAREGGGRLQVTYMHLDSIAVKKGDTVQAGQKLGVSGNTGTRTTGEHLHFEVKDIDKEGTERHIDPAAYLADIAQKGGIRLQALHDGNDLLAKYKPETPDTGRPLSTEEWMKKLLSSEDSGVGVTGADPVMEMAMNAYTSLMLLAVQIDGKAEEERKALVSEYANRKQADLTALVPGMKSCTVGMEGNGKAVLRADNGIVTVRHELTAAEMNRLSLVLADGNLSDEAKRMRVAGMVNGIVLSRQAAQNYELGMSEGQERAESLQRK